MIKSSRADLNSVLAGRGWLMGVCQATEFAFISILGETAMPAAKNIWFGLFPPLPVPAVLSSSFLLESSALLTLSVGSRGVAAWFLLFHSSSRAW